ncbi:glycosyl hydrolase [Pontibacter sp. G13]|uniref:glycosyl hydrolase n=1 Tax=Pontibacter sp. G13 TaxID=3074898 RepID=UPI00288AB299|nr:glycosyl hydrolase [Pontibacter sp. G13]WNJ17064.1 glycosyl hydrolase [Pontibacter sp. G13]
MDSQFAKQVLLSLALTLNMALLSAQIVNVGGGSYTTNFPGVDAAGRNGYPSGTPFTTGIAATKPIPTNEWWSHKVKNDHSGNLFNYPFTMETLNEGLVVTYIPWGPIDAYDPVIVGVSGMNANAVNVSDFSDWTVTLDWANGGKHFTATSGIGMPFVYFTKGATDVAEIVINEGTATISNERILVEDVRYGADFVIYGPTGSTWTQSGNTYTSSLNGQNYWSLAFLPENATSITAAADDFQQYAYVFPTDTRVEWDYNEATSLVTTDFTIDVDVKEGTDSTMLIGLLPHQWDNLSSPATFASPTYPTVRGELKTMAANGFAVQKTFHGILPTLPYLDYRSPSFSPGDLNTKVKLLENDALNPWTDSYNEGQEMNRLIQTARIAELSGDSVALNKLLNTVKARLEDWLSADQSEVAFLFYYNQTWSALIGYPAGHGQDHNLNDHHFHWGYFIHAAAFLEQYQPGWAAQWGDMINLLVRDAASADRNDPTFPFLRNFSPYAGHCWANGFASFPQGNDQESTSESMQFNSSLIHWGTITGNDSIRDLGIYLYTTEQAAVEEYWFDKYERNFGPNQNYSLVSRVWGNSYDNGTFWTADIAASYGIELYPIHGGSLYLGHDTTYVRKLWTEIEQNTGILSNEPNVNLWHDIMWEYLAFIDPQKALDLYDSYPDRALKFGVTDAQTYHWLHAMNVLGTVDVSVTADHPLAVVFDKAGDKTYVAQNYSSTPMVVTFSDGFTLPVPARTLATSKDVNVEGSLSSSFDQAYPGGSVDLTVTITEGVADSIGFFEGDTFLGNAAPASTQFTAANLPVGVHTFYARIYDGPNYNVTNLVTVSVGEQIPYSGTPAAIPGAFEAGDFDLFEGGVGNGISYQDMNLLNQGGFRAEEYVDASDDPAEGHIVGWIAPGEWLEYTVDVAQPGNYTLSFRYASGNQAGGGPFSIFSDGVEVASGITVNYSGSWESWTTQTVSAIPLKGGEQVIRISFQGGELNLGELTFTYDSPLNYSQPIADAGENQIVVLPQSTTQLDGSASSDPAGGNLTYEWTQVYGPSVLQFTNSSSAQPTIQSLQSGVYLLELEVSNGTYSDIDQVYVISNATANILPVISISSPSDGGEFIEGDDVTITTITKDFNDSVVQVKFLIDQTLGAIVTGAPFEWTSPFSAGEYELTAIAYDSYGDSTVSSSVHITVDPAPSCFGTSWDGEFSYEFSEDDNNPTVTFIPSQPGMGSPTCILYYGTNSSSMPGYPVTPNVPYQLNASEGEKIFFYYTYSHPSGGERNNSANKDSYVIGSCRTVSVDPAQPELALSYYPNPVKDRLFIELLNTHSTVSVYNMAGKQIHAQAATDTRMAVDVAAWQTGIYLVRVSSEGQSQSFLVRKE